MNSKSALVRWWLLPAMMLALTAGASAQSRMGETGLRMLVTGPKPVYPPALQAKKTTGVAVAAVLVNPDGRMGTVVVLEAPDPLMSTAVQDALMQWRRSARITENAAWSAKLTFYFQIRNGIGVVLNPDEMPGARKPEPPAGAPGEVGVVELEAPKTSIGTPELQRLLAAGTAVVVDVRERDAFRRGHRNGAINIPMNELQVRGSIELPTTKTIVIVCEQAEEYLCTFSEHMLADSKLRVTVLKP
jgi:hypothetical protein